MNRVIAGFLVLVSENFNAQQPDDRSDTETVTIQFIHRLITADVQVHLHAFNEFVKKRKRHAPLFDEMDQLAIDGKLWLLRVAGAHDVFAPGLKLTAALIDRDA